MGRYINWADVSDRYPRVANDNRDAEAIAGTYIAYAEAEVDARLAPGFTVPFSNNNMTVRDLSIDLTLVKWGVMKDGDVDKLKESVEERIAMLLAGTMGMMTNSGSMVGATAAPVAYATTNSYHPVFGLGDEVDMGADVDRVEAEEDARD